MIRRVLRKLHALARPPAPPVEPPPLLHPSEQSSLLRLARAAVAHQLDAPAADAKPAMGPSLLGRTEPAFVSFWVDGRMRGCRGAGGGRPLVQSVLAATQEALVDERVEPVRRDEVERLRIEIDVLGPSTPFHARRRWQLERAIEPGIHGLSGRRGAQHALFKSSVAITRNWSVEELARQLADKGGWGARRALRRGVQLARFQSTAFIESPAGDRVLPLLRANVPLGYADWSRERLCRAIDDGAGYLLRAQRPDGGFAYEYAPATDDFASNDNLVRQVATAWVVATLARRDGSADRRDSLARALAFIRERTRRLPLHRNGLVVSDEPDGADLGSVAFAVLTLVAAGDSGLTATAERFGEAILSLQRPDGAFHTRFPGTTQPEAEDFFPGEAMLALMHLHATRPDPRYPEALHRALPYYRDLFRRRRSSAFVAWQIAAYAHLFRFTGAREAAEFAFELTDAILPLQYVGTDVPYPDYVGSYRSLRMPGIASATVNEGVLEAYDLARRVGDRERAARYHRAAVLAALFTLRLQFTPDNAYFVVRPDRALGGFRATLADSSLRIDHTQHALNSLLKAERYLFAASAARRPFGDAGVDCARSLGSWSRMTAARLPRSRRLDWATQQEDSQKRRRFDARDNP